MGRARAAPGEGRERRHGDDRATLSLLHALEHRLANEKGRGDVDREDLLPQLERGLDRAHALQDAARVGEEDIDRPELFLGLRDHPLDGRRIRHVGLEREPAPAELLDLGDGRARLVGGGEIGERDVGAGASERERGGAPDAGSAPGDERDAIRKARPSQAAAFSREWAKSQ